MKAAKICRTDNCARVRTLLCDAKKRRFVLLLVERMGWWAQSRPGGQPGEHRPDRDRSKLSRMVSSSFLWEEDHSGDEKMLRQPLTPQDQVANSGVRTSGPGDTTMYVRASLMLSGVIGCQMSSMVGCWVQRGWVLVTSCVKTVFQ